MIMLCPFNYLQGVDGLWLIEIFRLNCIKYSSFVLWHVLLWRISMECEVGNFTCLHCSTLSTLHIHKIFFIHNFLNVKHFMVPHLLSLTHKYECWVTLIRISALIFLSVSYLIPKSGCFNIHRSTPKVGTLWRNQPWVDFCVLRSWLWMFWEIKCRIGMFFFSHSKD